MPEEEYDFSWGFYMREFLKVLYPDQRTILLVIGREKNLAQLYFGYDNYNAKRMLDKEWRPKIIEENDGSYTGGIEKFLALAGENDLDSRVVLDEKKQMKPTDEKKRDTVFKEWMKNSA